MGLYEHRDAILILLDRGSWKNSWHMPKLRSGYIDWSSPATVATVQEEVILAGQEVGDLSAKIQKVRIALAEEEAENE